jgi:hypothetical protein
MSPESWTAAATLALVAIGSAQAALFLWQLILLRRSVRDSANAARAAAEAVEVGRAANRISREAIASEQRPWVTLTTYLNRPLPVSFGEGSSRGWRIELRYEMTNVGRTPARRVSYMAEVIPFLSGYQEPGGGFHNQTNVANELHDFTRRILTMKAGGGGFNSLLFPGDTRQQAFIFDKDESFTQALASSRYSGQLIVMTCVVYQSPDGNWHETAEAYSLAVLGGIKLTDGRFDLAGRTPGLLSHPQADPYAN